jgi:hypothetical protein
VRHHTPVPDQDTLKGEIAMPSIAQTIPLDLAGFTWLELTILVNHLHAGVLPTACSRRWITCGKTNTTFTPKEPGTPKNNSPAS